MDDRIKVMLTTEGTYPYHQGGVSTWCDILAHNLREVDFIVYSIVMNPFVTQKFTIPEGGDLIKVPLWGTEEPSEHLTTPFSQVYLSKKRTTSKAVKEHFIPIFRELIEEFLSDSKDPQRFGRTLVELHKYFQEFEYKNSFKDQSAWEVYKDIVKKYTSDARNKLEQPNVYSLIQSIGWIYRFLNILNTPLPKVHVTHSAAAAFCSIPGVVSKIINKTPFLLTEHGVYLREQYLSLGQRKYPSFLNTFLVRMIHSVSNLSYTFADQVSPVCHYNTRWEKRFGVQEKNIKVIYNGVNNNAFTPDIGHRKNANPTVVAVARIDPIKDVMTLIRAAAIVRDRIPNVKFIIYGSVSVPSYYDMCIKLKDELGLNDTFIFAGHTNDVPAAYRSGDIIALSSISEAFPYSVVEAMMTGKPVIATDVGGIKEALGDTGILVNPRKPDELALGIIKLLDDDELRFTLGEEARQRALNLFSIQRVLEHHLKSYLSLAAGDLVQAAPKLSKLKKQRLLIERGFALLNAGFYQEAVIQLKQAMRLAPDSKAVPVILTSIAEAYNCMGQYDMAFNEMQKAELIMKLREKQTA